MTLRTSLSTAFKSFIGSPSQTLKTPNPGAISRRSFLDYAAIGASAIAAASLPNISFSEEPTAVGLIETPTSNLELHQKVIDFSTQAFNELKPALLSKDLDAIRKLQNASMHWNNLGIAFNVADDTGIDVDIYRKSVLEAGLINPNIPKWVLHEAMYTTGKRAQYLNSLSESRENEAKKAELLSVALNYFDRNTIPADVVGFTISQLCDQKSLDILSKSFIQIVGYDRGKYSNVFAYTDSNPRVKLSSQTIIEIEKDVDKILNGVDIHLFANKNAAEIDPDSKEQKNSLSQPEKLYTAKSILALVRNNADYKQCALSIAKYFQSKANKSDDTDADYIALRALLELNGKYPNEPLLKESLKVISTSHPDIFFNSYFCANATSLNSVQSETGKEISKLFNSNNKLGNEIILNNLSSPKSRSQAIQAIASLNSLSKQPELINTLRSIIQNKNEPEQNRVAAMKGLGRIKDETSLEPLLEISIDESNPTFLRGEALYTTCLIDAPALIPKEFEEYANSDHPYGLELYFFGLTVDADTKYVPWTCGPNIITTSSRPDASSISGLVDTLDQKYGGKTGKLAKIFKDQSNVEKYITPLINYLNKTESLDLDLLLPSILILGHSENGAKTLDDIIRSPWEFANYTSPKQVFTEAKEDNGNEFLLKLLAIQSLGGAIDLKENIKKPTKTLIDLITKETHASLYMEALYSEFQISKRFKAGEGIDETRKFHINSLLRFLEKDTLKANSEPVIVLKDIEGKRYLTCASLVNLGAEKELVDLAFKNNWVNLGNEMFRIIAYALKSNGFRPSDISKLGLDNKKDLEFRNLYDCVANDKCFLGKTIEEFNLDGEGVEVAIVDGGFPMFFKGELESAANIAYPKDHFGPSTYDLKSKHARTVTHQILQKLPKTKILPYTWDKITTHQNLLLPNDRFDPATQGLIDLLKGKVTGKNNVQVLDMSFGHKSPGMSNNPTYADYVNRRAAAGHLAVDLGVSCNVSVGNDRAADPVISRNMALGGVNALLAYVGHGKRFIQPEGVFRVASYDEYRKKFIETSGTQDPLNTSGIELVGVHGYTDVSHRRKRGIELTEIYPATSFAVPNKGNLDIMAIQHLRRKGIKFDPKEHNRLALETAITIPDREPYEANKVLSAAKLFERIR